MPPYPQPCLDSHLTQPIGWSSPSGPVGLGPSSRATCASWWAETSACTDEPDPVPSAGDADPALLVPPGRRVGKGETWQRRPRSEKGVPSRSTVPASAPPVCPYLAALCSVMAHVTGGPTGSATPGSLRPVPLPAFSLASGSLLSMCAFHEAFPGHRLPCSETIFFVSSFLRWGPVSQAESTRIHSVLSPLGPQTDGQCRRIVDAQ